MRLDVISKVSEKSHFRSAATVAPEVEFGSAHRHEAGHFADLASSLCGGGDRQHEIGVRNHRGKGFRPKHKGYLQRGSRNSCVETWKEVL